MRKGKKNKANTQNTHKVTAYLQSNEQVVRERGCSHDFVEEGHKGSREIPAKDARAGLCKFKGCNVVHNIVTNVIVHIVGRVL